MSFERECYMSLSFYSENSLETCWFSKKLRKNFTTKTECLNEC